MFATLLESRAIAERNRGGRSASVVLHISAIAVAVLLTRQVPRSTVAETVRAVRLAIAPPPDIPAVAHASTVPAAPRSEAPALVVPEIAAISLPDALPPVDLPLSMPARAAEDVLAVHRSSGDGLPSAHSPSGDGGSYYALQVERVAAIRPGVQKPVYPELLRDAGIEGAVQVAFVIDTTGRVEMASLRVVRSTHPAFTSAVRDVLPKLRFFPAEIGGRKVRQVVELPFAFTLK